MYGIVVHCSMKDITRQLKITPMGLDLELPPVLVETIDLELTWKLNI